MGMADELSSVAKESLHAAGFLLIGGFFCGLTWLQIQLIGPRWNSIGLVLALIVMLFLLRAVRHARGAMRAAAARRDHA